MGRILLYGDGLFYEMVNKKLRPEGKSGAWLSGGRALGKGARSQAHYGPKVCSGSSKGCGGGESVLRGGGLGVQSKLDFAGHLQTSIVMAVGSHGRVSRTKEVKSLELSVELQKAQDFLGTCSAAITKWLWLSDTEEQGQPQRQGLEGGNNKPGARTSGNQETAGFKNGF